MDNRAKLIMGLSILLGFICGAFLVLVLPLKTNIQTVTKNIQVPVDVVRDVTVYIDREVKIPVEVQIEKPVPVYVDREVKVPVEVIRNIPVQLKDFDSLDNLTAWLWENNPKQVVYATFGQAGSFDLTSGSLCCSQVDALQLKAAKQGFKLERQVISAIEYFNFYGTPSNCPHAVCAAWIGKNIYYIEPFSPLNKIWLAGLRGDRQ